jgi:hypothetical protein
LKPELTLYQNGTGEINPEHVYVSQVWLESLSFLPPVDSLSIDIGHGCVTSLGAALQQVTLLEHIVKVKSRFEHIVKLTSTCKHVVKFGENSPHIVKVEKQHIAKMKSRTDHVVKLGSNCQHIVKVSKKCQHIAKIFLTHYMCHNRALQSKEQTAEGTDVIIGRSTQEWAKGLGVCREEWKLQRARCRRCEKGTAPIS